MDPSRFSKPEKAILTSAFHCVFCSRGQALKIQHLPDNKIQVVESIDFKTLIKDDPAPFYIGGATSEEENNVERLSEDAALSMMVDED